MVQSYLDISIVLRRTPVVSRWISERWEPVAVELAGATDPVRRVAAVGGAVSAVVLAATDPAATAQNRVVLIDHSAAGTRWCFHGHRLELHRSEAEGYYLNLTAPEPRIFVLWRMLEPEALQPNGPAAAPVLATVSYNEAARMLDGGEQVDAVPLLPDVRAWMEPFVAEHYKPEPKRKVRRRDPLRDDDVGRAGCGPADPHSHDPTR